MSTTDAYIQKRREGWYVVVEIPKGLREHFHKPRFVQTLKTRDRTIANVRKWPVVADIKRQIDIARRGLDIVSQERSWIVQNLSSTEPEARAHNADIIESIERTHPKEASELEALAQGLTLLRTQWPEWKRELEDDPNGPKGQTISQHGAAVRAFIAWGQQVNLSGTVEEVTRKRAGEYVAHIIKTMGSRKTAKRHLSSLAQFWLWLESRGVEGAVSGVWYKHRLGNVKRTRNEKRPYTDEELVRLLDAPRGQRDKYYEVVNDLMRLDLFNGARMEEWCGLESRHVSKRADGYWVTVTDGKNESALRSFPVAACVAHIVERRLADGDKYLFKDLIPGGPDRKRMWYISKSFARLADRAKVEDPNTDFHSFRRSFQDACEGVGIPESTTKLIVGHARESMTYGLYSKGTRVDLRKAVERVRYGASVMKLVRRT
jgi:integrase